MITTAHDQEHWEPLRRKVLKTWGVFDELKTAENLEAWRNAVDEAEAYANAKYIKQYKFFDPENKATHRSNFISNQKTLLRSEERTLQQLAEQEANKKSWFNWSKFFFCCKERDNISEQETSSPNHPYSKL